MAKRAAAGALHSHYRDLSKLNSILTLLKKEQDKGDKRAVTIEYKSRSGPDLAKVVGDLQATESKLKSMTQGKGTFSMTVDHLEICPPMVQDKVIKDSGFKVEADED